MKRIDDLFTKTNEGFTYTINRPYRAVFGLGEKFDAPNHKGKFVRAMVKEKCFYQGEFTYLSMPYFMTTDGFGVYVNTYTEVDFDFTTENSVKILIHEGSFGKLPEVYLLEGTPKQILGEFRKLTSMPRVFPKWVLGAWMSSNRWNCQVDVEEQLELTKNLGFPHNVLVVEPWSDLTTHYLFSGSKIPHKKGDEYAKLSEIDFSQSSRWQNPKKMIDEMHDDGIRILLWVVPIYAQGVNIEGTDNLEQLYSDNDYVKETKECVLNADGTPYEIPHTWCVDSMVPDFTDEVGTKHWFDRFSYLLDMGIDGFKTDGGEFIHDKTVKFKDGTTGLEGQNAYPEQYTKAFADFVGEDRIVFSRAGGQNTPSFSVVWAGDQESTWEEYRSVVKAGISAGTSGINCWGYDISGFSGYLPSAELYLRATQTAAFLPVMQWHSDPVTNNRCDFTGAWKINDRSPWNISAFHKDPVLLEILRRQFYLHYNLMPYFYSLMTEASKTGVASIRALALEFSEDENVYDIDDQFMLGNALMVAPVLEDYIEYRSVYLPKGNWYDLYTGEKYDGGVTVDVLIKPDSCPVFVRDNVCVPLNLKDGKICSDVGNDLDGYKELTFLVTGEGSYDFSDDLGNEISITWDKDSETVVKNSKNLDVRFKRADR